VGQHRCPTIALGCCTNQEWFLLGAAAGRPMSLMRFRRR